MSSMERRMEILETLCRRRNDTVENLANEFGVSKRTIKYDIEYLSLSYTITEMMIEEAISLHNFEQAIKEGGIHAELLNAVIQKLDKEYTNDELRSYLVECGSKKHIRTQRIA